MDLNCSASVPTMPLSVEARVHRVLVFEAREKVKALAASGEAFEIDPIGICWPSEPLRVDGSLVAQVVVELSTDPKDRRRNWLNAIARVRPFSILQIVHSHGKTEAIFESICGARSWLIERESSGLVVRERESSGLGYLYSGKTGCFSSVPFSATARGRSGSMS